MEPSSGSSRFRMSEGDWICSDPQCGNVNFARRDTCNRCDKEKGDSPKKKKLGQEIGKAAAEKSRGLFSADDWQCNKCGNVNWARRQSCNMCNAPKYGEVEERTGYGGGYNDRGVVEYIERQDSDDEYDEFGRRKRRKKEGAEEKRSSDRTNDVDDKEDDEDDEEDEEEEEEDDDEDEDLSKYDLSGWGDDDTSKENKDKETNKENKDEEKSKERKEQDRRGRNETREHSKSRSRSRSPSYKRSRNNHSDSRSSSSKSRSSSPATNSNRHHNYRSRKDRH